MGQAAGHDLSHLSPAASGLAAVFARPKTIAVICVVSLVSLGWLYLALLTSGLPAFDALCSPFAGGQGSMTGGLLMAAMWGAMTLAMMLPSAAPMFLTYSEIADTAARKASVSVCKQDIGASTYWQPVQRA